MTARQHDWLHSSFGRASHRHRGGHGFDSRWSLKSFFQVFLKRSLRSLTHCDDHIYVTILHHSIHVAEKSWGSGPLRKEKVGRGARRINRFGVFLFHSLRALITHSILAKTSTHLREYSRSSRKSRYCFAVYLAMIVIKALAGDYSYLVIHKLLASSWVICFVQLLPYVNLIILLLVPAIRYGLNGSNGIEE